MCAACTRAHVGVRRVYRRVRGVNEGYTRGLPTKESQRGGVYERITAEWEENYDLLSQAIAVPQHSRGDRHATAVANIR
jgi:hypothetical protein